MKNILIIMLFLFSFPPNSPSESIFDWPESIIEVDVYDDINKYILLVKNEIKLKKGFEDDNFYIDDNNVNYTTISTISTSVLKSYTHYFRAVSPKNKTSEIKGFIFKIVDREKPKILSSSDILMVIGGEKPNYKTYLSAYDNYTPLNELIIVVDDALVDYKKIGVYPLIYTITDSSNNRINHISELKIIDNIFPTIKSTVISKYYVGDDFNIYDYFYIEDNYDKDLRIFYEFSSPITLIGETTLTVRVIDSSNNISELTKIITVIDNKVPEITIIKEVIYLEVFSEEITISDYYNISDNYNALNELRVEISSEINYQKIGKYDVSITVFDLSNNKNNKTIVVYIIDSIPPLISGADLIKEDANFDLYEGLIISDNYNLEEEVVVLIYQTNFKSNPGKYYIIYEAKDLSGNMSYFTRNIIIKGGRNNYLGSKIKIVIGGIIIVGGALALIGFYIYKRKTNC